MTMLEVLGIAVGIIAAFALFYPMERDRDRKGQIDATIDRYDSRYGR